MDFAGPLPNKEIALVMWDQYARYPVVEFVTTTSARAVLPVLERVMANYGIPEEIKTDKRPPFNGREFTEFAEIHGFKHRKVKPRWAETNGDVERFIQTLKKSVKIAGIENRNIRQAAMKTLKSYRDTPHRGTGESSNKLMFGRELNGKLPMKLTKQTVPESVLQRDNEYKQKCKKYADRRRHTKPANIRVGSKVLVRQEKMDGLTPRYNPEPFEVIGVKGSMVTVRKGNRILCRNSSMCKILVYQGETDSGDEWQPRMEKGAHQGIGGDDGTQTHGSETSTSARPQDNEVPRPVRPSRKITSTKDTKYKDYMCDVKENNE